MTGRLASRHVCWIVDDDDGYAARAAAELIRAPEFGQRPIAFGPRSTPTLERLGSSAAMTADPHHDFLDGGPLVPERMFEAFRTQTALARRDGYAGLRVVADMDWMLPARPAAEEILQFELLLDRVVAELDATVICAYRRASFDRAAITGALCVHPEHETDGDEPAFTFVAAAADGWRLAGEVDLGGAAEFRAALEAAACRSCTIDVAELDFMDVPAMRAIAEVATESGSEIGLRNAGHSLARHWKLAGFDADAPRVRIA